MEQLKIHNSDGTAFYNAVLESYTYSDKALGFETTVEGSFVSELPLLNKFRSSEYVLLDDVKYILLSDVSQSRESDIEDKDGGLYRYSCKFFAPKIELTKMMLLDPLQGGRSFIYFTSEKRLFDLIEANLPTGWSIVVNNEDGFTLSETVLDEALTFNNATVSDAVAHFYDTHHIPYNIQGRTIYIGQPTTIVGHTFRMEHNGGLKNNPVAPKYNNIATRVFPVGSADNLPYPYPKLYNSDDELVRLYKKINIKGETVWANVFQTQLMPAIYRQTLIAHIAHNFDAVNYPVIDYYDAVGDDYINKVDTDFPLPLVSENTDIKPTIEGATYDEHSIDVISDVSYMDNDNDNVSIETGEVEVPNFYITLPAMGFDLYAQAAITGAMTISMKSGNTIGCKFKLQVNDDEFKKNFYDVDDDGVSTFNPNKDNRDYDKFPNSTDQSITVLVQKDIDTYGWLIPNVNQAPDSGDKYVLLYIEMPDKYVIDKELELSECGKSDLLENNTYHRTYPITLDEGYLHNHPSIANQITTNSAIKYVVVEGRYDNGIAAEVPYTKFVQSITKTYNGDDAVVAWNVELSDEIVVSKNQVQQNKDNIAKQDTIIKNETIKNSQQARRNSYVTQKVVEGIFDAEGGNRIDDVEANTIYANAALYGQNANDFAISGGNYIISSNSIQLPNSELSHFWGDAPFDNKNWNVQGSQPIQLDIENERYYVYVQANRANNSAIWIISTEQKIYNQDSDVWFFNSGQLINTASGWSYKGINGITSIIGGYISTQQATSPNYELSSTAFTGMLIDFLNSRIYMGEGATIITNSLTVRRPNSDETIDIEQTIKDTANEAEYNAVATFFGSDATASEIESSIAKLNENGAFYFDTVNGVVYFNNLYLRNLSSTNIDTDNLIVKYLATSDSDPRVEITEQRQKFGDLTIENNDLAIYDGNNKLLITTDDVSFDFASNTVSGTLANIICTNQAYSQKDEYVTSIVNSGYFQIPSGNYSGDISFALNGTVNIPSDVAADDRSIYIESIKVKLFKPNNTTPIGSYTLLSDTNITTSTYTIEENRLLGTEINDEGSYYIQLKLSYSPSFAISANNEIIQLMLGSISFSFNSANPFRTLVLSPKGLGYGVNANQKLTLTQNSNNELNFDFEGNWGAPPILASGKFNGNGQLTNIWVNNKISNWSTPYIDNFVRFTHNLGHTNYTAHVTELMLSGNTFMQPTPYNVICANNYVDFIFQSGGAYVKKAFSFTLYISPTATITLDGDIPQGDETLADEVLAE